MSFRFFRRNFRQIKPLHVRYVGFPCGTWLWLQVKWWIGILYYPSSHNHGSGKRPPWRLKPVILFRPPFSTMIMGERIDTWSPNLWCKVVGKGDFWSFQRWKAGLVDVVEPMWIASHTRAMTWRYLHAVNISIHYTWNWIQWLFLVPLKGGRWHIIPQLAVYTTYILPSGGLYATYHLVGEPETTIDGSIKYSTG